MAALRSKISGRIPSMLANQPALIRSFLIDSTLLAPSRAANCAKIFCCVHRRVAPVIAIKFGARGCIFTLRVRFARKIGMRKKSLFHRSFCNVEGVRAMLRDVFTQLLHRTT
jgi:glucokinase